MLNKRAAALSVFGAVTLVTAHAQTFTTLAAFDGSNGASPILTSLVQGLDGNLYGNTQYGGLHVPRKEVLAVGQFSRLLLPAR